MTYKNTQSHIGSTRREHGNTLTLKHTIKYINNL